MARHLATCDRKSGYETAELAQLNTVKCNMLDMLGLVRRDGEEEEDSSESLLIPADQQQQLLSKSIDRKNDNDANEPKVQTSNPHPNTVPNAIDDFNTQLSLDDLAPPQSIAPQTEPDRTPQLSDEYQVRSIVYFFLFPVSKRINTDITFLFLQSLATPRVTYNAPQYENNDYEMAPNN